MTKPANPTESPATAPRRSDKSATAPGNVNPLVGLAVFSSDGSKMGTVQSVSAAPAAGGFSVTGTGILG